MTNDIIIDYAQASDAPILAELAARTFREAFGHLYNADDLHSYLGKTCCETYFTDALRRGDALLIAYDGQDAIGYAQIGKLTLPVKPLPPGSMEINRLYVTASHGGRGIGTALMETLLQLPMVRAAKALYLGVYEHNYRAQRFYGHYGFTPAGQYVYYVGLHADNEIIMMRDQTHKDEVAS